MPREHAFPSHRQDSHSPVRQAAATGNNTLRISSFGRHGISPHNEKHILCNCTLLVPRFWHDPCTERAARSPPWSGTWQGSPRPEVQKGTAEGAGWRIRPRAALGRERVAKTQTRGHEGVPLTPGSRCRCGGVAVAIQVTSDHVQNFHHRGRSPKPLPNVISRPSNARKPRASAAATPRPCRVLSGKVSRPCPPHALQEHRARIPRAG